MRAILKSTLAAAACLAIGVASAVPITYNLNLSIGEGTAIGQITTDGKIGQVGSANIVSYSILLSPVPGNQFTIDEDNSDILDTANLIGSLADLSFDFSVASVWLFQNPAIASGVNYLCLVGGNSLCGGFSGPGLSMGTNSFGADFSSQQGVQVIATAANAVPEPASWGLVGLALLAASAVSRRRQA